MYDGDIIHNGVLLCIFSQFHIQFSVVSLKLSIVGIFSWQMLQIVVDPPTSQELVVNHIQDKTWLYGSLITAGDGIWIISSLLPLQIPWYIDA